MIALVVSTSESYTFTVSANVTLIADFRRMGCEENAAAHW
jgi:hypothetical protein